MGVLELVILAAVVCSFATAKRGSRAGLSAVLIAGVALAVVGMSTGRYAREHNATPAWGTLAVVGLPVAMIAVAVAVRGQRPERCRTGVARGVLACAMAGLLLAGLGVLRFRVQQSPPSAAWVSPPPRSLEASAASEPSLDAMWDHLTKGRIALETPAAETASVNVASVNVAPVNVAPATVVPAAPAVEIAAPSQIAAQQATASSLAEMQQSLTALRSVLDAATKMAEKLAAVRGLSEANATPTNSLAATSQNVAPAEYSSTAKMLAQVVSTAPKISLSTPDAATQAPPAWVNDPQKLLGDSRTLVLKSDPYATTQECRRDLETQLATAVGSRTRSLAAAGSGGIEPKVPDLGALGLSPTELLDNVYRDDYVETIETSVGDMQQARLLVEFTPEVDKRLLAAWQDYARVDGVRRVGGVASLVMSGLALAYGLLKVDTWTRGYYTKRLFLGVPAGIIALVALLRQIG